MKKGVWESDHIIARKTLTDVTSDPQDVEYLNQIFEINKSTKSEFMGAKNIILYGPPGTGKTYSTIDKAVEIINGRSMGSHEKNKIEFDRLKQEGLISFVTFHQNYSYEDFMIGIRPDLNESTLKFAEHKGVFYRICKEAENNYLQAGKKIQNLKPFKEIFELFLRPLEDRSEEIEVKMISGNTSFWITEINPHNLSFRKQSGGTGHTLSFETLEDLYYNRREFTSGLRIYYQGILKKLWELGKVNAEEVELKKYVLIIDEINRANISKVFGELITLLEDDKRLGGTNELTVTIPNSEVPFGVPPNLYLIGTMNTADKSIALVDIALRRRFEFNGKYPIYEGYDAAELLGKINQAIYEERKSADYLIGHAYFMNNRDVKEVLQTKVIPLLMEYFSGKTEIVSRMFSTTGLMVNFNKTSYTWDITEAN
jgi:5-methylcytosine-specific restriction protein B